MFNPMGMAMGLVLARQREVENPLVPALVAGAMPMPMGLVAALLLTENRSAPVAPEAWDVRLEKQLEKLKKADTPEARARAVPPLLAILAERNPWTLEPKHRDRYRDAMRAAVDAASADPAEQGPQLGDGGRAPGAAARVQKAGAG